MQFGTLVKNLAVKAGIKADDPKLVELLAVNATIPDDIASALDALVKPDEGMFTLESAKNNPDLQKHFNAKIFNGMDAKLLSSAEAAGVSEEDLAAIKAEKNSYAKWDLLKGALQKNYETELGKHKGDKQPLLDEINKLKGLSKAEKEQFEKALKDKQAEFDNALLNHFQDNYLTGKNFANSDIPKEISVKIAKELIANSLAAEKGKVTLKDGKIHLINAELPDLGFQKNNKDISYNEYADSVLAANKLLKVTDPNAHKAPGNTSTNTGTNGPNYSKALNAYDKELAALQPKA